MLFVPPGYYYWKRVESKQFTNYFNSNEFSCKCGKCEEQMISIELVYKLECLRNLIHSPLKINEGFRCKGHQEDLKRRGYETSKGISQHELGNAADIYCPKKSGAQDIDKLLTLCHSMLEGTDFRCDIHIQHKRCNLP